MKRVSFKVAIALKEAGYPQKDCSSYYDSFDNYVDTKSDLDDYDVFERYIAAPYVMEAWLWLWKVKKIAIPADYFGYENNYWESCVPIDNDKFEFFSSNEGPEEVIEKAIEYLVTNDLIK